jgi:hypothetical protein
MSEVTVTVLTVVLRYAQVQNHDLIALAGVFQGTAVGGFNANRFARAVNARRAA